MAGGPDGSSASLAPAVSPLRLCRISRRSERESLRARLDGQSLRRRQPLGSWSVWFIWSIWFIWFIRSIWSDERNKETNQINQTNQINEIDRYGSPFLPDSINNPFGTGNPYSPTNPYGRGLRIEGK